MSLKPERASDKWPRDEDVTLAAYMGPGCKNGGGISASHRSYELRRTSGDYIAVPSNRTANARLYDRRPSCPRLARLACRLS